MELVRVYKCLCDARRLRILALLLRQPLCVCHLQTILAEPQVKVSQQLAVLRRAGLVEAERRGTWMVYRLPAVRPPLLRKQLACLQDCVMEDPIFRRDALALERVVRGGNHPLANRCQGTAPASSSRKAGS
ncbi:MAG: metalloregulator ArsR/SmtB family transcription factor [Verrucomicrobiia bacterium]